MRIEKLEKGHKKTRFDCGNDVLNSFLKRYAYQNQQRYPVGVTYVAVNDTEVIGYVTLSASSIRKTALDAKKPYEEIPMMRIARLAVDKHFQGHGIGSKLLRFAFDKAKELKERFGCTGVVVDAKEQAVPFYERYGFIKVNTFEKGLTVPMYLSMRVIEPKGEN